MRAAILPWGPILAVLTGCAGDGGAALDEVPLPEPLGECEAPVAAVNTSSPDAVVGDGSPESCTAEALAEAVEGGGIVTFDCGPDPVTIALDAPIRINNVAGPDGLGDTVIDGGGLVTLSGGGASRILEVNACEPPYNSDDCFASAHPSLTVQNLAFRDGRSGGGGDDTDVGGGAIYRRGGRLVVIDSTFANNEAPLEGQDVAGGAIYAVGGTETIITGSSFAGNRASNGGAVGVLHSHLTVVNTAIEDNAATGTGGNPGNGGNGGGIYSDGNDQDEVLCGVELVGNTANAFGGGMFRVSNNGVGTMDIDRSTVRGNTVSLDDPSKAGGMYLQGFELTITNSTFADNEAGADGALFLHLISSLEMANSTVTGNTAHGLGGGITIGDHEGGSIVHCTFARNRASGEGSFAAAINGSEPNLGRITLRNSLVADHEAGNAYNPLSCLHPLNDGGGNLQWPEVRVTPNGSDPDEPCAEGVTFADPGLGPLEDAGGPTPVALPEAGGPADGAATDCAPTDQRGEPRADPCTAGAVEL
ncbi:MAG: choice-of-anchor Q domain-containing protein [Myxococcota bacterium]